MLSLSLWRFVQRAPWSTLMAVVGIALGVTSVVSVHLISQQVSMQLDGLRPQQLSEFSHYLHRDDLTVDDYFELRRQWRAGAVDGLRNLTPVVDEWTVLQGRGVHVIGVDLFSVGTGLWRGESAAGRFSWTGIWVDDTLADLAGVPINDVIDLPPGTLVADIGVAQELLGWKARDISYVATVFEDPWADLRGLGEQLIPGLGAGLPAYDVSARVPDWQVLTAQQQHPASQFGNAVLFNVSALAILAMLVAWFLIYQVALSWRRKLLPTMQRLHLLGVSRAVLGGYFVLMLLGIGMAGGLLGMMSGWGLAQLLIAQVAETGAVDVSLDVWTLVKGLGSALGVCLVGGGWAMFREQIRRASTGLVLLLIFLALLFAWGLQVNSGLLGAFACVAVLSFVSVLVTGPLLRRLRAWSAQLSRSPRQRSPLVANGLREVVWYPDDLAVALGGLTLAIATAIGVAAMVESFRADFEQFLERRLSYTVVVSGAPTQLQHFLDSKSTQLSAAERQQIGHVQPAYQGQLRVAGLPVTVTATQLDAFELARYQYAGQYLGQYVGRGAVEDQFDVDRHVLISEQLARAQQLQVGDVLQMGDGRYPVAAVFQGFGDSQARLVVDQRHPLGTAQRALDSISLRGAGAPAVLPQLTQAFPQLRFTAQGQVRDTALTTFDRTFAITDILISIALMVAGIGVYIANSTLRLNQQTSSRLLVTLGISARERLMMDVTRSLGIAFTAVIMAIPLGAVFGYLLCELVNPRAFGWTVNLQLSLSAFAWPVVWGTLAALVAGFVRVGQREESQYANLVRL